MKRIQGKAMRYLPGAAIVALLTITSCNQKHCWNCRIEYKNSVQFGVNGQPGTGVKTLPVCDMTKKEIEQYEADNSTEDAATNSSVTYDCVRDYYK